MNGNFVTGKLFDENGKNFDITVILNWPTVADYEAADDIIGPSLIDFYFGDANDRDTAEYANSFIEKQNKFKKLLETLVNLQTQHPELNEYIDFVKSQIIKLY